MYMYICMYIVVSASCMLLTLYTIPECNIHIDYSGLLSCLVRVYLCPILVLGPRRLSGSVYSVCVLRLCKVAPTCS